LCDGKKLYGALFGRNIGAEIREELHMEIMKT